MLRQDDPPAFSALMLTQVSHSAMVKRILLSHGFHVLHLPKASAVSQLSSPRRFDLAVYDEEVPGALELAGSSHKSLHRVAIGLLAEGRGSSAGVRLHFAMRKPLNDELLEKAVKAAFAPIAADRRASFRYTANIKAVSSVLHHLGKSRQLYGAAIVNLSLTGLCIETNEMLPQHSKINVVFPLPPSYGTVHVSGTIVWSHASGRSGIMFMNLRPSEQRKLEDWADSMYSETMLLPR